MMDFQLLKQRREEMLREVGRDHLVKALRATRKHSPRPCQPSGATPRQRARSVPAGGKG